MQGLRSNPDVVRALPQFGASDRAACGGLEPGSLRSSLVEAAHHLSYLLGLCRLHEHR